MSRKALSILLVALVLVASATAAVAASLTSGGDAPAETHMMPSGQDMNGEMRSGSTHTMNDGSTMEGGSMGQ